MWLAGSGMDAFRPVGEAIGDIAAYFVAANANGRPNGGVQVNRISLKIHVQFADCAFDDTGGGPTPACVHGGHGAVYGIDEQYRNTVRCSDTDCISRHGGDERVAFVLAVAEAVSVPDEIGVNLAQSNVSSRISLPRPKAMDLPFELVKVRAAVDPVFFEKRGQYGQERLKRWSPSSHLRALRYQLRYGGTNRG